MLTYGFVENSDFLATAQKRATAQGNMTAYIDHILTLDMAKEIAMIQRTEKTRHPTIWLAVYYSVNLQSKTEIKLK